MPEDRDEPATQELLRQIADLADRLDPPDPLPEWADRYVKALEAEGESVAYVYLSPRISRAFASAAAEVAEMLSAGAASKAAALGAVSWAKGLVWLTWPYYEMGGCERSRLVIMPV